MTTLGIGPEARRRLSARRTAEIVADELRRQIIDGGNWDASTGIHFPGQSGHPGSRHYRDMIGDWTRNTQQPLAWSAEAVAAAAHSTLVLTPAPVAASVPVEDAAEKAA